jgi:putative SOS response-associated peptidase YedK
MCARFNLATPEAAGRYFQGRLALDSEPRYNIAPSEPLPCVYLDNHDLALAWPTWNLTLGPRKVINIRTEGQMMNQSRWKRCLVCATGFFEWREEGGHKQPYNFVMRSGEAFAFAALSNPEVTETAILTTTPNELVAKYHDRMPSIIASHDAEAWLEGNRPDLAIAPFPAELMDAFPVTRKMGNPRYKGSDSVVRHLGTASLFE